MKPVVDNWLEQELMLQEVIRAEKLRNIREEHEDAFTDMSNRRRTCRRRQIKRCKRGTL
ncbi:hypothetical protein ACJW8F_09700 [Plesiomonas shigelloides]|uniref:hypothetical protein n=1 Tax=Plesiomonas shigelloides TaxID=703 RepID=UPI00387F0E1C